MVKHMARAGAGALAACFLAAAAAPPIVVGERWACRTADASNPQNVTATIGGAPLSLACRPVNVKLTMSDGRTVTIGNPQAGGASASAVMSSPQYSGNVTASGLNDRWVAMMKRSLGIASTPANGTVNVGNRWVCRPADAQNAQNASMTGSSRALACRPINLTLHAANGVTIVIGTPAAAQSTAQTTASAPRTVAVESPQYNAALSPAQLNDAWVKNTYAVFGDPSAGGP